MKKLLVVLVAILALAVLTVGLVWARPPQQGPVPQDDSAPPLPPSGGVSVEAPTLDLTLPDGTDPDALFEFVSPQFNYQGRLLQNGSPFDGSIQITFTLYFSETDPTYLWQEVQMVTVTDGLFNVMLGSVEPMDGLNPWTLYQLWLGVWPEGVGELTPRQRLAAVPYAMTFLPGASVYDTSEAGWYAYVLNVGATEHSGILGHTYFTDGIGIYGLAYHETGVGVYGKHTDDAGTEPGVKGESDSTDWYAAAVVGRMTAGDPGAFSAGVRGISEGTGGNGIGVWGSHPAGGWGVYGTSVDGFGVYGQSANGSGVRGFSSAESGVLGRTSSDDEAIAGVRGENDSGGGAGVVGYKDGTTGVGVRGMNDGDTGSGVWGESTEYYGLFGESTNHRGVYGRTARSDNNYGLYTPDNLWSLNFNLAGAIMYLAQNGGPEALEPGDVVVFSGLSAPLGEDGVTVAQVRRADGANSTAVAGVVYSRFNIDAVFGPEEEAGGANSRQGIEVTPEGPVPAGEYLLIVVQGPALVRASALNGAIRPGDLLASAPAGLAAHAGEVEVNGVSFALPGSILGKALEPLADGEGMIRIFVTLK